MRSIAAAMPDAEKPHAWGIKGACKGRHKKARTRRVYRDQQAGETV